MFRTCPDRPWNPPSLLYNGYLVFPGGKAAGAWRWLPTPSSTEVKETIELYLYSPSGPSWHVLGWILPLPLLFTVFEVDSVPTQQYLRKICTHVSLRRQAKRVAHKGSKKHKTRTVQHGTCFLVRAFLLSRCVASRNVTSLRYFAHDPCLIDIKHFKFPVKQKRSSSLDHYTRVIPKSTSDWLLKINALS